MKTSHVILMTATTLLLWGCASPPGGGAGHGPMVHDSMRHGGPMARAALASTQGNAAQGVVHFHAMAGGVMVHGTVSGLKPMQEHGFHIHEKGDCSSGDGMSTGGHFNPHGHKHGSLATEHHAGDLPSLKADAQGVAQVRVMVPGLSIGSGAADILGRGLIVHAQPDDYTTQPTGNAGARIACAVIQREG